MKKCHGFQLPPRLFWSSHLSLILEFRTKVPLKQEILSPLSGTDFSQDFYFHPGPALALLISPKLEMFLQRRNCVGISCWPNLGGALFSKYLSPLHGWLQPQIISLALHLVIKIFLHFNSGPILLNLRRKCSSKRKC